MEILPRGLTSVMVNIMTSSVPKLLDYINGDTNKLKKVFKGNVFQQPINPNILDEIKLHGNPLLEKEIVCLHIIYNSPDSVRLSSINNDETALKSFREKMLDNFIISKKTAVNFLNLQRAKEENASTTCEENKNITDEEFARILQMQFDDEYLVVGGPQVNLSDPGAVSAEKDVDDRPQQGALPNVNNTQVSKKHSHKKVHKRKVSYPHSHAARINCHKVRSKAKKAS